MRSFVFLLISSIFLAGCLNNDVLDKDLDNSNFKESDFYTSGSFASQFGFTVEKTELSTIVSPFGDTLCEPTYTLRLNDSFVSRLSEEWSDEIIITVFQESSTAPDKGIDFPFINNYGQSFQFSGKSIDCNATSSELDARLILVAPNTGRATASITRKTLSITITP